MQERYINEDVESEEDVQSIKEELIYIYRKENNEQEDPLKVNDVTGDIENQKPEVEIKEEPLFHNMEDITGKLSSRKKRKQDISAIRNVDSNFDLIPLIFHQNKLDDNPAVLKKRRKPINRKVKKLRKPIVEETNITVLKKPTKHIKKISSDIYECAICWSMFANANSLQRHLRIHKTYYCEFCSIKFSLPFYYACHMRTHTGEQPYSCEFCEVKFSQKSNLNRHVMTVHSAEKPFECELCEMKFAVRYRLKRHKTVHDMKRPFKCKFCMMKFAVRDRLKRHVAVHEMLLKCEFCAKEYAGRDLLKKHVKSMHMGHAYGHECKYCDRVFFKLNCFKKHVRNHLRNDCSEKFSEVHTPRILRSGKQLSS